MLKVLVVVVVVMVMMIYNEEGGIREREVK
jgi:hypothetical protein